MKPASDAINSRFRPKKRAIQPVSGKMIALATRYDVSTQRRSSMVAERFPAMCGSDTLTTVVSSTSMKAPNMTATATSQGLTCRCVSSAIAYTPSGPSSRGPLALIQLPQHHNGNDRHPRTQAPLGILTGIERIFTGTRWTTFT